MLRKIFDGTSHSNGIFPEVPYRHIAPIAQQAANLPGGVVVINAQAPAWRDDVADSAKAVLSKLHNFILLGRDTKFGQLPLSFCAPIVFRPLLIVTRILVAPLFLSRSVTVNILSSPLHDVRLRTWLAMKTQSVLRILRAWFDSVEVGGLLGEATALA
jgi:hypothetical protein